METDRREGARVSRNVARGTMLGIGGQGWQLVTVLFLYAYLARVFGPALFGNWQVVLSVLAWFEIFVQFGVVKVATKAISETPERCHRISLATYASQAVVGVVVFTALVLAAPLIARLLGHPALTPLLRVSALDVPLFGLMLAASSVVLGMGRFERQGVAWIVYATAKAVLIAGLVAGGFSVAGALVGNALSSLVGFGAMFVPLRGERPSRRETASLAGWMLLASVPFLTLALMEGLGQSVDLWIVSAMVHGRALVGYYAAAVVLAEIPVFLFLGLNRVIFPSVAGARADGDEERASTYAWQAVRLALIVSVLGVGLMAALGRQVLRIEFGFGSIEAYVPAVLLMAAGMGRTVRGTCTEVLMAHDRRREALTILSVTVVLEAVAVAVLLVPFGLNGAAAGAALTAIVAAIWGMVLLRGEVGARPLVTTVRCAIAAGVTAVVVGFIAPAPTASTAVLVFASAGLLLVGGIVYLALLWLLRELSATDVRALVDAARGRSR